LNSIRILEGDGDGDGDSNGDGDSDSDGDGMLLKAAGDDIL